jgi:hypothetical protein
MEIDRRVSAVLGFVRRDGVGLRRRLPTRRALTFFLGHPLPFLGSSQPSVLLRRLQLSGIVPALSGMLPVIGSAGQRCHMTQPKQREPIPWPGRSRASSGSWQPRNEGRMSDRHSCSVRPAGNIYLRLELLRERFDQACAQAGLFCARPAIRHPYPIV